MESALCTGVTPASRAWSVIHEACEERRIELLLLAAAPEVAAPHALAHETGALEHALGRDVADAHVRLDAVDPVREPMLGGRPHATRRDAAPTGLQQQPVTELDRIAKRIEVVDVHPAEHPLRAGFDDH